MKHWPRWKNTLIPSIHWDAISEVLRNNGLHQGWCLGHVEFPLEKSPFVVRAATSVCHDQGSLWCNIGVQGFEISCIFWQWNPMIFKIWILVTFQVNRWQRQRWFWAMPDFWRTKTIENLRFDRLFGRKSSSTTVGFGAPNVDFWKHDYVLTCMHDLWPNLLFGLILLWSIDSIFRSQLAMFVPVLHSLIWWLVRENSG